MHTIISSGLPIVCANHILSRTVFRSRDESSPFHIERKREKVPFLGLQLQITRDTLECSLLVFIYKNRIDSFFYKQPIRQRFIIFCSSPIQLIWHIQFLYLHRSLIYQGSRGGHLSFIRLNIDSDFTFRIIVHRNDPFIANQHIPSKIGMENGIGNWKDIFIVPPIIIFPIIQSILWDVNSFNSLYRIRVHWYRIKSKSDQRGQIGGKRFFLGFLIIVTWEPFKS